MKNNKLMLIACFIILLSLNSISATTDNDTYTSYNEIQKITDNNIETNNIKESSLNTIYVDINSKKELEDGSQNNPFKTINNENLDKIPQNTIIHIAKGTYNLNSTTINTNISIVGENPEEVIITSEESSSIFTINTGSMVLFKNLTIKDFTSNSNAAITNNGNLIIENTNLLNNIGTTTANNGGSIINNGNLEIINTTFEKNTASFGAAIYNTANVTIKTSQFTDNNIYNVGGAIYSTKGNLTVYDSYFTNNRAVSGAAIYNAFGYLYVNNTIFNENDAEYFFGGAIYSTGVTITNNSIFDSNHATKDGGAITTTSNFTVINCTFTENFANENGGVIENVPWSEIENGNLTIINSTFRENTATLGGVIINYGKVESKGENATVTVRGCVFDSNTAETGGVIYNEQFVDMENNVFKDNEAYTNNVIYTKDDNLIKSLNNNWWSTNNPSLDEIGYMPQKWFVMNFTNTTSLYTNQTASIKVSLNTLNTGETLNTELPSREVLFESEESVFDEDTMIINDVIENTVYLKGDNISAQIDNQKLILTPSNHPMSIIITLNPINESLYKDKIEIMGKFTDINGKSLINSVLNININGKIVNVKTNNKGVYKYNYKTNTIGTNNVTVSYHGNVRYSSNSTNTSFNVQKKGVVLTLNPVQNCSYKDLVTVYGRFSDINGHGLMNTIIRLQINNKTVKVKTGNNGSFNYSFSATVMGTNNITARYLGNKNYGDNSSVISFGVSRKDVILAFVDSMCNTGDVHYKENVTVGGYFADANHVALKNTLIHFKVGNKTGAVKTDEFGAFSYSFKATEVGPGEVTATFNGNSKYASATSVMNFTVLKQDLNITVNPIKTVKSGNNITISGKLTDKNGRTLMNSNIKLKLSDKSVIVKTNKNGIFTYDYMVSSAGNKTLTVSHSGNNNFNPYVVKTTFQVLKI